ncbi:MAG: ATP-binding protein [Bacilli bacterium]
MPITKTTIERSQLKKILDYKESHFVDLKAIDIAPSKLSRTIAAFANADGGEIYIGIDETDSDGTKIRTWRGFSDYEAANGHLQIFEQLFPLGQFFEYMFLECQNEKGLLLKVDIHKAREIVLASNETVYVRRGAQNLPFSTEEQLHRLRLDKGIASFENETVDVELQRISNSYAIIEFMLEIIPTNEPDAWLRKQLLVRDQKPTVGGLLLFDDEPQAVLPKRCGIKIFRYKTLEPTRDSLAFDPITIEGNIYEQIRKTVEKTKELVEGIKALGPKGLTDVRYPHETLHEIITNAVLHRDYSIPADVQIRIFDNRIEVESPGRLPGHITVHNILDEQFARNGTIVRIINKFPNAPNKDVGEGLNTAFDAMRKIKLKDPKILEQENSLIVQINHEPLASTAELIVEYLQHNPEINNSTARRICFIGSENVMKRIFEKMILSRVIERVPGKRGKATAYRLIQ